jgi:hypothetical protein
MAPITDQSKRACRFNDSQAMYVQASSELRLIVTLNSQVNINMCKPAIQSKLFPKAKYEAFKGNQQNLGTCGTHSTVIQSVGQSIGTLSSIVVFKRRVIFALVMV